MSETVKPSRAIVDPPEKKKRLGVLAVYARRFFRNKTAIVGLAIFGFIMLYALLGEIIGKAAMGWSYDSIDFTAIGQGPSETHWFGADEMGSDLFVQMAHGTRLSIMIALIVSLGTTAIAAVIGCGAAYAGGRIEKTTLSIIHFLIIVPSFLIMALLSNSSGGKWYVIALVLIALGWMGQSRVIYSLATSLREREYIYAARYMGVAGIKTVVRHMVPNIGSLLIIQFALGVIYTIMGETALSFLGFGIKIPEVSLGSLLGASIGTRSVQPWSFWFPAVTLTLMTVSMALIADGLRDALDPNSASGGKA